MKSRNVVNCRSCGSIRNSSLGLCYLYLSLLLLFKTAIANAVCALRQELLAYSHIPFCHHSPFSSVKNLPTAIHFFGSFGSVVGVYAFSLYSLFSMDFNIHFFLRTYFLKLLLPSVHTFLALGLGVSVFFFFEYCILCAPENMLWQTCQCLFGLCLGISLFAYFLAPLQTYLRVALLKRVVCYVVGRYVGAEMGPKIISSFLYLYKIFNLKKPQTPPCQPLSTSNLACGHFDDLSVCSTNSSRSPLQWFRCANCQYKLLKRNLKFIYEMCSGLSLTEFLLYGAFFGVTARMYLFACIFGLCEL